MTRVLIYGMNYPPEFAGVGRYTGEIGEYLSEMGHDVIMVTALPHYPAWQVMPPYRNGAYYSERQGRVKVIRCPLILHKRVRGIWRLVAPLSFAVTSAPIAFWQILRQRPQTVLCIVPTLFTAPIAIIAARLVGARTVLHVQDLEVDASFAVGHLGQKPWLKKIAYAFERLVLRGFDRVITLSGRMAERLAEKNIPADRIATLRNWVDLDHLKPLERQSPYRREYGIADSDCVVLYSGTLGVKQGFDYLLEAAAQLANRTDILFLIAGEGPAKSDLTQRYGQLPNVRFLPFQPYARLSEFLGVADLHVLPQAADAADLVLPSKLGGMLASGRRILVTAAAGTELAHFLEGAAIIVPPGDATALRKEILRAAEDTSYGGRDAEGRLQLANLFSKTVGLKKFEAMVCMDERGAFLNSASATEATSSLADEPPASPLTS
jgi:colanic acid biosynthesis glycosyl transferase WcaI